MSRSDASRRSFLKAVGASAATLPFFHSLAASAAPGEGPLRFVGIFHPHGVSSPLFTRRPQDTESNFDLRYADCVLSPFDDAETYGRSFKDKLLVLEGIDLAASVEKGTQGHGAPPCILTGSGGRPTHSSLDQYLAVDRKLGEATRITSLVLGVGDGSTEPDASLSFGSGGAALSKILDPRKTFSTLFASFVQSEDAQVRARAERDRLRGRSVIDFLRGDLKRLQSRLAPTEQRKLDQHLSSVRDLEKRLEVLPAGAACSVPGEPQKFAKLESYNGGEPYFEQITNLQIDLLAQAMACDITRFATLWLNDLSRGAGAAAGIPNLPEDCHALLAHQYVGPRGSNYGDGGAPGTPSTWRALGVQNRYSYSKCARLLQRFNEYGILDDVVVLMSGEMGDPNAHSSNNVPMLLAGGCGGKFRMGRHLKVAENCPPDRWYCNTPSFVSNNKVLVSIAQAFGLSDVQRFGVTQDTRLSEGELPGLR